MKQSGIASQLLLKAEVFDEKVVGQLALKSLSARLALLHQPLTDFHEYWTLHVLQCPHS